jgi:MGT family glycosyltransferase
MSRAFLFNIPAHGHTNPTLPLVRELTGRGEHIVYYSSDTFREKIEEAGAEFRSYSSGVEFDCHNIDNNIFVNAGRLLDASRRLVPQVLDELAGDRPDYVIHDSMCVWGKYLARILKVPAVCSVTMFAFGARAAMASLDFTRAFVKMFVYGFSGVLDWLRGARELHGRYGIYTFDLKDVFTNREPLNIVYTSRLFQPLSRAFDRRFKFVGPSIAGRAEKLDLPLDERDRTPVLYVSLGTIVNESEAFYRKCFEAFGEEDLRVVMSVGRTTDIGALGEVPGNFIVRNRVPQLAVLERASAFVTHSGMNSVSEAMLARVPLVLVPQTAEQAMIARQVARLGAGVRLSNTELTPARLRSSVRSLLADSSYRASANAIAESFESAGGYARAADEVFAFKAARGID